MRRVVTKSGLLVPPNCEVKHNADKGDFLSPEEQPSTLGSACTRCRYSLKGPDPAALGANGVDISRLRHTHEISRNTGHTTYIASVGFLLLLLRHLRRSVFNHKPLLTQPCEAVGLLGFQCTVLQLQRICTSRNGRDGGKWEAHTYQQIRSEVPCGHTVLLRSRCCKKGAKMEMGHHGTPLLADLGHQKLASNLTVTSTFAVC